MLQENEQILKKFRPELFRMIREILEQKEQTIEEKVKLAVARDGSSVVVVHKEGKDYRLNSAFRPVQEADRWAAQFEVDHLENIVVLFGLGNGIFARSLMKRLGNRDKLIVYEPSLEIFRSVLDQEDIGDLLKDPRIRFVLEEVNPSDFYFVLERNLDWRNMDALSVCCHPGYQELFMEQYVGFLKQIKECKELVNVVKNTDVHFAHRTVENIFRNMRYIRETNALPDFYQKMPEGFPVIIVSAGPSLDKNIDELKRAEGKAFILAVDSAVNSLIQHGINFDGMITVDAGKRISHISREECQDIPLFCVPMSRPEILEFHQGKKIWITGSRYLDSLYAELGHSFFPINIGGSVATAAFSACEKMGFTRIVLIGQDLAYCGDTTHAGGVIKKVVNEESGQQEVDGLLGDKVRSRYDWIIYRNWFESAIQQLPDVQVIDATEGGALIHGSDVMTLAEVIDTYCRQEFSMRELLEQAPPTFDEETYQRAKDNLLRIENEMKTIRRKSEDAVIVCDQVVDLIQQSGNEVSVHKQAKKLAEINQYVVEQRTYQLLDYYVTDTAVEDLKEINQMTGNKEQDLLNTYYSAKAMYESMIHAVNDLKDLVHESLKQV